jgi:hypothetical protein
MDLNLRKARKLEAKILAYANAMSLTSAVKVRIMANEEERSDALSAGRSKFLSDVSTQKSLILARFNIRQAISDANQAVGINALINKREGIQALLEKSTGTVDALDYKEATDLADAKKRSLESGDSSRQLYGETSVTFTLPVALAHDVAGFKAHELSLKRQLEEIEDELSQKNLGAKVTLPDNTVKLLQSVGLL